MTSSLTLATVYGGVGVRLGLPARLVVAAAGAPAAVASSIR